MSPLETAGIYARQADELAAEIEQLAELNRQQARMLQTLSAAFEELHTALDELAARWGSE